MEEGPGSDARNQCRRYLLLQQVTRWIRSLACSGSQESLILGVSFGGCGHLNLELRWDMIHTGTIMSPKCPQGCMIRWSGRFYARPVSLRCLCLMMLTLVMFLQCNNSRLTFMAFTGHTGNGQHAPYGFYEAHKFVPTSIIWALLGYTWQPG